MKAPARQEPEQEPVALVQGRGEDLVLREEAGEETAPRRAPPPPTTKVSVVVSILGGEPAHLPEVLLPAEAVDDAARAEEEQRLEEGVGDEVEDAGGVGAHPDADEHVAELADRGVGEHALDVGLDEADGGGEDRGEAADPRHHLERRPAPCSKSLWQRATMYTPAVTMVAAWMSADTGVGPSIASGSQM